MEALLLLADGRFPGGGYAHSGGLEAGVAEGTVDDLDSLERFVIGRLATVGLSEAWLAAAACTAAALPFADEALARLDDEAEARIASPALRAAGRALGRGLRRAAIVVWPAAEGVPVAQQPVVLGAVSHAAGLTPLDAARAALHGCLLTPLNAAPKLMAIDMADALAIAGRAAALTDALVADAIARVASSRPPVRSAPFLEERAERHVSREVRLFAS